ncbi:uncharacterized protein [Paramisgurnus dabryanus]|uniref:uncharacterized protein n=1 Tax=Paramisgurnus dabryanus TaxID=90735 RepID=UPI0031F3EDF9
MARIPHRCVTISACLAGALLLLPLCWGVEDEEYDYDSTQFPDYNETFEFSFFSNASREELENITRLLFGVETDTGEDSSKRETDENVLKEKPTKPTVPMNQASRSAPVRFITLLMMVYQLLRLL